ncbi:hypothetical protein AAVH_31847, partial [Aphelenchoides avenae]
ETFGIEVDKTGRLRTGPVVRRLRSKDTDGPSGTEAACLVLQEAFSLGYRRVEWECGNDNDPSKKASLRLGFTYEALHPQRYTYKGQSIDAVTYSILDKEWPPIKRALEEWLAAENHSTNGQRVVLSEFMRRYRSQKDIVEQDGLK